MKIEKNQCWLSLKRNFQIVQRHLPSTHQWTRCVVIRSLLFNSLSVFSALPIVYVNEKLNLEKQLERRGVVQGLNDRFGPSHDPVTRTSDPVFPLCWRSCV